MDKAGIYGAMDTTSRVGVSFGTRLPESSYEDFASILEACEIEEEVATDNDVRMEVATTSTSGGAGALPTPILETPVVGPKAGMGPRVMDGVGGKAGNQNKEEEFASIL